MAYNTRSIKKDVDGRPVPQYFNLMADDYEPLLGENGAARSVLYGPNGQPLSVIDNKLAVRAADLETLLGSLNDSAVTNPANAASVIAALKGLLSVVGKEATLGQILLALGSLATESTLASLASSVAKEATLSDVKSAVDTLAGIVSDGAAKVTLSGHIVKRTYLGNKFTFTPSEEWVLLEDYELGENTIRWGLFFKEHARPLHEVLEKLAVKVSVYNEPGNFGRINGIFERTMYPSLEDSPLHPLAIPGYDDQQQTINNIILYNKPFTYNFGRYLRISLINKGNSNMAIARAMLVEEGYQ